MSVLPPPAINVTGRVPYSKLTLGMLSMPVMRRALDDGFRLNAIPIDGGRVVDGIAQARVVIQTTQAGRGRPHWSVKIDVAPSRPAMFNSGFAYEIGGMITLPHVHALEVSLAKHRWLNYHEEGGSTKRPRVLALRSDE